MFTSSSSFATLYNLTTSFIFKVYAAPNRIEQTLHTVDSSAETEITEVEQVDSNEELSYKGDDILCQPEEAHDVYVAKKVSVDEQVFIAEDSLRKFTLPSQETVTKDKIPEIKAEPIIQKIHSETNSETSGVVKNDTTLPDLVLKSDVSQKTDFIAKVVAQKEAVSMKVIPKVKDIKLKKELKMSEIGTFTCAIFGIFTLFTHFIQSVLCIVLHCLPSRQAKLSYVLLLFCKVMLFKYSITLGFVYI